MSNYAFFNIHIHYVQATNTLHKVNGEYTKDSQSTAFKTLDRAATRKSRVFHLSEVEVQFIGVRVAQILGG